MPANLTPEYRAAELAFRRARDLGERLDCLREMLRVMPKHKGTDHLQGDIKRRIKELSEELGRPRNDGARGGPTHVVRPEGAAQLALIGPPNAGKSLLHSRLTGSGAQVASYPFTTQHPEPGMMPHEDIHFQLVDLPAVAPEHSVPWLAGLSYPALAVSAVTGLGLGDLGPWLFGHLGIARVYTKVPGQRTARDRPFVLRRGQTVDDVARVVHKDLARSLKYARVWGRSGFDGQHVGRDHPLEDGDLVELHS